MELARANKNLTKLCASFGILPRIVPSSNFQRDLPLGKHLVQRGHCKAIADEKKPHMKTVIAISERFGHMGRYSGYDRLFPYLEKQAAGSLQLCMIYKEEKRLSYAVRIKNKIAPNEHSGTPYYTHNSYKAERSALRLAKSIGAEMFHIAYLENNYGLPADYRKLRGAKLMATVHQPPSWWRVGPAKPSMVGSLDILCVLDALSREYFSTYLPPERVHFIPHGVDTEFFSPSSRGESEILQCLFVGQWLRDIEMLRRIIDAVTAAKTKVHFHLVYPQEQRFHNWDLYRIASTQRATFYAKLSDIELRETYQKCDLLVIPMIDCTANNGVLEAMACGLPVLSNDKGGIRDYVTDQCAIMGARERTG